MNYSKGHNELKTGKIVRRESWPDGQFLYMSSIKKLDIEKSLTTPDIVKLYFKNNGIEEVFHSEILFIYSEGFIHAYNPTENDKLSEDWIVVEI